MININQRVSILYYSIALKNKNRVSVTFVYNRILKQKGRKDFCTEKNFNFRFYDWLTTTHLETRILRPRKIRTGYFETEKSLIWRISRRDSGIWWMKNLWFGDFENRIGDFGRKSRVGPRIADTAMRGAIPGVYMEWLLTNWSE